MRRLTDEDIAEMRFQSRHRHRLLRAAVAEYDDWMGLARRYRELARQAELTARSRRDALKLEAREYTGAAIGRRFGITPNYAADIIAGNVR